MAPGGRICAICGIAVRPRGGGSFTPRRLGAPVEPAALAFLVAAGFVASFVDAIVGGGGVITLPALIAAGLPPHVALGTNKLAATGASASATWNYARHGVLLLPLVALLVPFSLVGAVLGAATVVRLPGDLVRGLVAAVVVAMTLYVLLRPRFGEEDAFSGVRPATVARGAALALAIGFYDGFLGPGTGSFLLFGLVALLGFGFLRAAAHGRVLNLASNLAALAFFAAKGYVDYRVGLPMMAAMLVGGFAGSRFGIRHGTKWIKPLFVAMAGALAARLLWDLL